MPMTYFLDYSRDCLHVLSFPIEKVKAYMEDVMMDDESITSVGGGNKERRHLWQTNIGRTPM